MAYILAILSASYQSIFILTQKGRYKIVTHKNTTRMIASCELKKLKRICCWETFCNLRSHDIWVRSCLFVGYFDWTAETSYWVDFTGNLPLCTFSANITFSLLHISHVILRAYIDMISRFLQFLVNLKGKSVQRGSYSRSDGYWCILLN